MSKLSKRDRTLLLVIGLFVALGGTYWFYVKPARADLATTKEAVVAAQDNVTVLEGQLAKLTQAAKKPSDVPIEAELRLAKAYPYSEDIPAFILQIEELAKATKVDLGELSPTSGTDYAGVTGTPFTVSVSGKFFAVQDFLYSLHNRVTVSKQGELTVKGRLLAVTRADLAPDGDATSTAGPVTANITILAFSRTPGGATPAADGGSDQPAQGAAASTGGTSS